jgi:signal transduction histidine kinase
MGIALQNSRLFGQLSKRSAELQEINTKLEDELAERRKIQEELEKAMELAKAAAVSKNQFLANMSHEVVPYSCFCFVFRFDFVFGFAETLWCYIGVQIRTPLNAIIGMTGLLLDTQLTETQLEWLNLIEVSGNALLSLVSTCSPSLLVHFNRS